MKDKLTCLIISDLHVLIGGMHDDDSFLTYVDGKSSFESKLLEFLQTVKGRNIDCLICPGDIGNKADRATFNLGWQLINKITKDLAIPRLYCVPGNHDYDSIKKKTIDPRTYLKFLKPIFPTHSHSQNTSFWAWYWVSSTEEQYNSLMVDTSAFQGFDKKESSHGRITEETVNQIIDFVSSDDFPERPINIMVLHHNPYNIFRDDIGNCDDFAYGADYLLSRLTSCSKGPWFVVHGHKHIPGIKYASTGTSEFPVIFSAGTLAAKFYKDYEPYAANQLYIVDLDLMLSKKHGRAMGIFETFEYGSSLGWIPAQSDVFPRSGGFGSVCTPSTILFEIKELLRKDKVIRDNQLDFVKMQLRFLTPDDKKKLMFLFEKNNIFVTGEINELTEIYGDVD